MSGPGLRCAFCGKTQAEVKALIAGQAEGLAICDECIGVSVCILLERGYAVAIPGGALRSATAKGE